MRQAEEREQQEARIFLDGEPMGLPLRCGSGGEVCACVCVIRVGFVVSETGRKDNKCGGPGSFAEVTGGLASSRRITAAVCRKNAKFVYFGTLAESLFSELVVGREGFREW